MTPVNGQAAATTPRADSDLIPLAAGALPAAQSGEQAPGNLQVPSESAIYAEERSPFVQRLGEIMSAWSSRFKGALVWRVRESSEPGSRWLEAAPSAPDDEVAENVPLLANAQDFNPLPREAGGAMVTSEEIFAEIGRHLIARRQMLGLTYEEIERHTRVRTAFLSGLEQGALEDLPSPVQTRGILANYAGFLDLDVDTILLRFADGLQARHRERKPQWPTRTRAPMTVHTNLPPLRSFIASDLVFGGGVAIMLFLFALWGVSRVLSVRSAGVSRATAPSISDVLAGTAAPLASQQVTLIPAQPSAPVSTLGPLSAPNVSTLNPGKNVQLQVAATGRTYMRITVDGKIQFEGRAVPGMSYSYQAASQIEVLVGNAAALQITHNGEDLGLMGTFGEVVDRLYTSEGVVTPTATLPPTRTSTANLSATPSVTPTRTPSVTPTPKAGG